MTTDFIPKAGPPKQTCARGFSLFAGRNREFSVGEALMRQGYRAERGCAIRRRMAKDHKMEGAGLAATNLAALYDIGDDEAGMRLDRWFRRRYPDLPQTHLNKIVRKGEVRVDGKRVEISTRLEAGQSVRVPPLRAPEKPETAKPAPPKPEDAESIRSMILYQDRD